MNLIKRRGAVPSSDDGPNSTKGIAEEGSSSGRRFFSIFTNEQLIIIFAVVLYQLYCLHSVSMRAQHACPSNSTTTTITTTTTTTTASTTTTTITTIILKCTEQETEQEALERRPEVRMWLGRPIAPIDFNDTSKLESSHPCSATSLNRPGPNSHPPPKYPRKSIVLIEYSKNNAHKVSLLDQMAVVDIVDSFQLCSLLLMAVGSFSVQAVLILFSSSRLVLSCLRLLFLLVTDAIYINNVSLRSPIK